MKHTTLCGAVCDVGCSTGEFLTTIEWCGPKYGMEVNPSAIQLAKASGISFAKNILTELDFFDVVVFRGTIQHLPNPFHYISKAYDALKPGGIVAFLATPNANSLVYKIFNTLPALGEARYNFFVPSDVSLSNILTHYEFDIVEIQYPYCNSPYANLLGDHLDFLRTIIYRRTPTFPFWKNMMNLIAVKH